MRLLIKRGSRDHEDLLRSEQKESKTHGKYRVYLFLNISLGVLEFNILENCVAMMCKKKNAVLCQQRFL